MKRIAALALFGALLVGVAPAHAEEPTCTVQPIVAGECVAQPVADYVTLQLAIIGDLQSAVSQADEAFRAEQAAHQETRLLLAEANQTISDLESKLATKQRKIQELRATIRRLRDQ